MKRKAGDEIGLGGLTKEPRPTQVGQGLCKGCISWEFFAFFGGDQSPSVGLWNMMISIFRPYISRDGTESVNT